MPARIPESASKLFERARKLEEEAQAELKELIVTNDQVHEYLIDALQRKLRSYQYDISSIPFEIFQNADDSYQELSSFHSHSNELEPLFVAKITDQGLTFTHWGRLINDPGPTLAGDGDRELEFRRDLEKMLTLSFSDKESGKYGEVGTTGKFGLGFKCVYFASATPRIVSGRLGFTVRGGFYPQQLEAPHRDRLSDELTEWRAEQQNGGTIIELPIEPHTVDCKRSIMERFILLMPIQLVFSRRIKFVKIKLSTGYIVDYTWREIHLGNAQCCYYGDLPESSKVALVLRPREGSPDVKESALLFQVGPSGFEKLNREIPSMWITTPTQEKLSFGLAVNGPFEPDVGRSRLAANSTASKRLTDDLAVAAGTVLIELFDIITGDWEAARRHLRLSEDCSVMKLWITLWDILTGEGFQIARGSQDDSVGQVMFSIIWKNNLCGYLKLLCGRPALPSMLWDKYEGLLSLEQVRFVATGILDTEKIFAIVSRWQSFGELVEPNSIISRSRVYDRLVALIDGELTRGWGIISLYEAVATEVGESGEVTPESAPLISQVINRDFIGAINAGEIRSVEDRKGLLEYLRGLSFKTDAGFYRAARELLVPRESPSGAISKDETLRAAFAPSSHLLSGEYDDAGIELHAICRDKMNAPTEQLAEWARDADKRDKLRDVFRYLLQGELRRELSDTLKKQWLIDRISAKEFIALSPYEQGLLKWYFRIEVPQEDVVTQPTDKVIASLEQISQWWTANKARLVVQYEAEIYPFGKSLNLSREDIFKIEDNIEVRKKWITLLILGSFHTMGRASHGQHRSFLEKFIKEGWLGRLADPNHSPESILSILDDYLADPIARSEYYQWMKQFISFYQSSKWLSAYVYSLTEIAKMHEPFALETIFNLRQNADMTGTGLNAPPLDRGLGIGACFIVRELLRCGFFDNSFAHEHAFVPRRGVRSIIAKIGGPFTDAQSEIVMSKEIFAYLKEHLGEEKAHFHKSFDIPFAVLAKHPELLHQLPDIESQLIDQDSADYFDD